MGKVLPAGTPLGDSYFGRTPVLVAAPSRVDGVQYDISEDIVLVALVPVPSHDPWALSKIGA